MQHFLQKLLFLLFLIIVTAQVSARTKPLNEKNTESNIVLTIRFENTPLKEALKLISQKVPVTFAYNEHDVDVNIKINASFENTALTVILDKLLVNNGYAYKVQNNVIMVSPAPKPLRATPRGGIKGKVYDEGTGETLTGASIVISGTTTGTITDLEGNFTLSNLAPGTYGIQVSFISYQKKQINNIKVSSGNYSIVDIPLKFDTTGLAEVVVHADKRKVPIRNTTELGLIQSIRSSDIMVTGISGEQISKSLDRDAGDVVKRAPGVSMLNKFVMVRGMSPRYNQTFINGNRVESTESYSRSFSFDLIPSGVIDAIELYKMPAPELPGGFGGGIIKVKTKQSQTARRIQFTLAGEYDTENSFKDLYTGSNDASGDWLGQGASDRSYPDKLNDPAYSLPSQTMYPEEHAQALKTMPPHTNLEKSEHNLNRSLGMNYYDSWRIGRVRLNNLTSLNYSYKREKSYRYDLTSNLDEKGEVLDGIQKCDTTSVEKVRLNALQSFNVVINNNHKIGFDLLANRNASDYTVFGQYVRASGYRPTGGATHFGDTLPTDKQLLYMYKTDDILTAQLSGRHIFGKHGFEWYYGQNWYKALVPDLQQYKYTYQGMSNDTAVYEYSISSTYTSTDPRVYYNITDKGRNGGLNYIFSLNDRSALKAGLSYTEQNREYETMKYRLTGRSITAANPWINLTEVINGIYDAGSGYTMIRQYDRYYYDNSIKAAYLGWKQLFFGSKLQVYGGFRYEYEFVQLYDADKNPLKEEITYAGNSQKIVYDLEGPYLNYWLPSVNLTWNITDKQKLRGAYGKTVDRPFARERSLIEEFVPQDGAVYQGNKTLKNAQLDNADLRWEYYPTESEFIAIGVFYKFIKNPIENFETSGETYQYRVAVNHEKATLYGTEVELRKNLSFLPVNWGDRFSVIANFTYTFAQLRNSFFSKGSLDWVGNEGNTNRPLTGSSPYLVNATLYYTDPKLKTQLAVNYNLFGPRLVSVSNYYGHLYENPHGQLDFTLVQPFGKYFTLKAGIQNALKKEITGWRDMNVDGKKEIGKEVKYSGDYEIDFDDALRISTIRTVYIGLTMSF